MNRLRSVNRVYVLIALAIVVLWIILLTLLF
jgi:hypothetical protein